MKAAVSCRFLVVAMCITGPLSERANAYEELTHEVLTEVGAETSSVSEVLRDSLGLSSGLETDIRGQTLTRWLRRGASLEDAQVRSLNHFHNPLAGDWGIGGLLGSIGQSSILWA